MLRIGKLLMQESCLESRAAEVWPWWSNAGPKPVMLYACSQSSIAAAPEAAVAMVLYSSLSLTWLSRALIRVRVTQMLPAAKWHLYEQKSVSVAEQDEG